MIYGHQNHHQREQLWMGTHNGSLSGLCMASLHPPFPLSEHVMFFCNPRDPLLWVFSSNETSERRLFLRTKKRFELFEHLCCGLLAAHIAIQCSTQVFLRVWFFGFSLQPPKCPENVFSKCGGLFFEPTFECWNEDIFRRKGRSVYKCTYRQQQNRRTINVPVRCSSLSPGSRLTASH